MKEKKGVNISSIVALVNSLVLLGMFFLPWFYVGRRKFYSLWDVAISSFDADYTIWYGVVFFVLFGALVLNAILKIFTTTKWLSILLSVLMTNFILISWFFFEAVLRANDIGIGLILCSIFTITLMVSAFLPTGKASPKSVEQRTNLVNQYAPDNRPTVQRTEPATHAGNTVSEEKDREIEELKRKLAALENENNSRQQQTELEAQRQREAAIQQQRETAMQQQKAMEAKRQREAAMQQRAMEAQRQREAELQRQRMATQQQNQAQQKPKRTIEKTTIDRSRFQ